MTFFISHKWYLIGEVLKRIFFGIAKVLAVERDVKPRNMNFAMVDGGTNRERVLIRYIHVYIFFFMYVIEEVFRFPYFILRLVKYSRVFKVK